MLTTELRRNILGVFNELDFPRNPSLRRAPGNEWLFSTDAPSLLTDENAAYLAQLLQRQGWKTCDVNGILLLDHIIPEPQPDTALWKFEEKSMEIDCCISILLRHPSSDKPDTQIIRSIAKAEEEGVPAVEKCCRQLHTFFAEGLRSKKHLPNVINYLMEVRYTMR